MAGIVVTMSADEAKLWKAQQKVIDQQEKMRRKYGELADTSKATAKAAREEATARAAAERSHQKELRKGQALTESLRTPQEQYNQALAEAEELYKKGAISAETHRRRVEQLKAEQKEATDEAARNEKVERARQTVMAKGGQVSKHAQDAVAKYSNELKRLDKAQKAGKISAGELATQQAMAKKNFEGSVGAIGKQNTLLSKGASLLGGYATAAGAASAAVGLIRAAWQTVIEEQEKGLAALRKTEDTERALLQISSPEQFAKRRQQSQELAVQTGVDIQTVQRVMFSAVSEGFQDALPEIIASSQAVSPESAATVAGQLPALFKGQITAMEAVDLTLKASKDSRLDFEDIARVIPAAAEGGGIANATAEETLAVLSVLASEFKSGDVAADRIKGFATVLGIDQGGQTAEDIQKATDKETARVERAEKSLRAKEERVADLEKRVSNSRGTAKETAETQLARARRDVSEFDRSSLQFQKPDEGRESLAGIGIIKAVEKLSSLSKSERSDFLGENQELNIAFVKIKDNLPRILQLEQEIREERDAFAKGGGLLRERVAFTKTDAESTARRENNIATQRLEASERKRGVDGAAADSAAKLATADSLQNQGLGTRVVGNTFGVNSAVASGAVAFGASREQAQGAAQGASLGFAESFAPTRFLSQFEAVSRAMFGAAKEQSAAAADLKAATNNLNNQPPPQQPSQTDAARRQAALANQGS